MTKTLLQKALQAHQEGKLADAEKLYSEVLEKEPDQADAIALMGVVLESRGKIFDAIKYVKRAVAMDPNAPLFQLYLGNVLMSAKDYLGAIDAFSNAISLQSDRVEFHYNLGNAFRKIDKWNEAKSSYERALEIEPKHALSRNNLALFYQHEKDLDEAVSLLKIAVSDEPNYGEGWLNLCNLSEKIEDYDLSLEAGMKSIALMPENSSAWFGLGVAFNRVGNNQDALVAYNEALKFKPNWAEVWDNIGQTYQFLNKLEDAKKAYKKVIEISNQEIKNEEDRKVDEKEYGNHHWHLALLELLMGDLKNGFARYRSRFEDVGGLSRPDFSKPVWQGENIEGKTILVLDEQGMGDSIMMARYLPLLKERGAYVKFVVLKPLIPLFENWEGADEIITRDNNFGEFDFYASVFDLPYCFETTLDSISNKVPYLPILSTDSKTDLSNYDGKKIAVVWGGAPLHKQDAKRSIPLKIMSKLFDISDVTFFSLNRDKREGDDEILSKTKVIDLSSKIDNFADTARFMDQMDLIISCDTSTAHLAGGLGKEVWTLLPFAPDWRWLLNRDDSPWYPTMRLFRQKEAGKWEDVIESVKDCIKKTA